MNDIAYYILNYFSSMFRRKPRAIKKNNDTLYDKIWEGKSTRHKSITDKVHQETKTKSAYKNSAYF